nr:TolC family protein [Burkholderiales bacterium]
DKYYTTSYQNLKIIEQQYKVGGANFTQLLNAQVTTNQALVNKLQAQSLKLSDTVALFQALGGGWWN